jgi:plasmid maintenance system antidote protein VapI
MLTTQKIAELLRRHLAVLGESDSVTALGKLFDVSRPAASNWVNGTSTMSDDVACEAAKMLNLNPAYLIAYVNAERAERAGKSELNHVWVSLCDSLEGLHKYAA